MIYELVYDITNNATGMLHCLSVPVDAWDDRGDKYDEFLFSAIENGDGLSSATAVPLGSTARCTMDNGFKERCEYLTRIEISDIQPQRCNIRMLPGNADWNSIVSTSSAVENNTVQ